VDENQLIAAIVASVATVLAAWALPLAIVIAAVLFRREVRGLLGRPLRRMKAWGLEAEWDEQAGETAREAVRAAAPAQAAVSIAPTGSPASLLERFGDMAAKEPAAAIMAAFREVEKVIRQTLTDLGYAETDRTPLRAHIGSLTAEGIITPQTAEAIRGLQVLRNLVSHRPTEAETPGRAMDYLAMADATLFALESNAKMAKAAKLRVPRAESAVPE